MLVSICMCTYKRAHLAKTLESIFNLQIAEGVELQVIVVDNDEALSGKSFCEPYLNEFPSIFKYISESEKNISVARNAGLDAAEGEWVAFIDDDEVADSDWLSELLNCAKKYHADAVFGKVISIYPEGTPDWIEEARLFDGYLSETGSKVSSGACGSALVNRSFIESHQIRFDLDYGNTGGEDAELFNRMYIIGAVLVTCCEAIVREEVEKHRLNSTFLKNKAIRIGQCFSRYRMKNVTKMQKAIFILKNVLKWIINVGLASINFPRGKSKYYPFVLKYCDAYGKIMYFLSSTQIEQYK